MKRPIASSSGRGDWLSVYFYPTTTIESLLPKVSDVLTRLKTSVGSDVFWFFIRYHDRLGSHLRLRILCPTATFRQSALDLLERKLGAAGLAETNRRGLVFTGGAILRMRLVAYRPEVGRYGGSRRIELSERFFRVSSEWVSRHVNLLGADYSKRVLTSGLCAYLLLRAGRGKPVETTWLVRRLTEMWIRTLQGRKTHDGKAAEIMATRWAQDQAAWSRSFTLAESYLAAPEGEPSPLHAWVGECRSLLTELDRSFRQHTDPKRVRVLQGWVHMHLNRMGLNNSDEALILYCLSHYFQGEGTG